jgi:hypothetical protein
MPAGAKLSELHRASEVTLGVAAEALLARAAAIVVAVGVPDADAPVTRNGGERRGNSWIGLMPLRGLPGPGDRFRKTILDCGISSADRSSSGDHR